MRNLAIYDGDPIDFFENVIKRKRNPDSDLGYKQRLQLLHPAVSLRYKQYDEAYGKRDLPAITEVTYNEQQSEDLLSLYKFSAKAFVDLKIKLTTIENNRISNNCQNCTIGEVGSFDHYLPKEKYPDFAVNPKNLIPSCSICNGHKSQNWQVEGKRLFINPYLDILPSKQFVFISISADSNDVNIKFNIENKYGIDADFYEILESHYTKLHLCKRFTDNCSNVVDETKNDLVNYSKRLPLADVKATIIESANDNRKVYGLNHFKYLLPIALVENDGFVYQYSRIEKKSLV